MTGRLKIPYHGPQHLPDGEDPIPGLGGGGALPTWFRDAHGNGHDSSNPFLFMVESEGGGDTQPAVIDLDAWMMIQTEDGTNYADGGTPLVDGTAMWQFEFLLDAQGEPPDGGSSNGALLLPVGAMLSGAIDAGTIPRGPVVGNGQWAVGHGIVRQEGGDKTEYAFKILSDGRMELQGLADTDPPPNSGGYLSRNSIRSASSNGTSWPAWPFDWDSDGPYRFLGQGYWPMKSSG